MIPRSISIGPAAAALSAAFLAVLPLHPLGAQDIAVDLEVTESTDGLFLDAFRTSLAGLGGVALAEPGEAAHYALTVAVLCEPAPELCSSAESFGVSIILSEPVTPLQLGNGLARTGDPVLRDWDPTPEARAFLQRYRRLHSVWTTSWDASSVQEDVDRLVRGIDARCFQQRRVLEARRSALLARGDTAAARNLPAELDGTGRNLC